MAINNKKKITLIYKCLHETKVSIPLSRIELEQEYAKNHRCGDCSRGSQSAIIAGKLLTVGDTILFKLSDKHPHWNEGEVSGINTTDEGMIGVMYLTSGGYPTATHVDVDLIKILR